MNLFLHELPGVEPIVSVARVYPDYSTAHLVGYVSQVSAKDLQQKQYLKDMSVGIAVGKTGLEKKLDKEENKSYTELFLTIGLPKKIVLRNMSLLSGGKIREKIIKKDLKTEGQQIL